MSIKTIAIGNRLMGDDGAAVHIAEKLGRSLEEISTEVIIGETDFQYCLSKIEEGDFIIIMDATWFGIKPGTVTCTSLKDIYKINSRQSLFSQHGYSLIRALEACYKSINGIVIGIEGRCFEFALTLSSEVNNSFDDICCEIYAVICSQTRYLRGTDKACRI